MEVDLASTAFQRIVPAHSELEVIAGDLRFGEGPVWNSKTEEFYWVDIISDTIWKYKRGIGREVVMRPSYKADGLTFDRQGRLLAAGWSWRRVWRREHDGTITTLCTEYEGVRLNSPNDIVCKTDGSIYFTDPSGGLYNVEMQGEDLQRYMDYHGVFRISPSGTVSLLVKDFVYPNGLAFSPDESLLYINDTRQNIIRVFKVNADGSLGEGRLFATLEGSEAGVADGMKIDVEGNVYCTGPGGIHVFAPKGNLLGRILIPGHCTNLAFGDKDWKGLYITTYTSLFRVQLSIAGLPLSFDT